MTMQLSKFLVTTTLVLSFVLLLSGFNYFPDSTTVNVKSSDVVFQNSLEQENTDVLVLIPHRATQFNHSNQTAIEYVFIFICLLLSVVFTFYRYIGRLAPPPWFYFFNASSKSRLGGWKESNVLYKARAYSLS